MIRTPLPRIEGLKLNNVPVERMMLDLTSVAMSIGSPDYASSLAQSPGLAGSLDQSLMDSSGAVYPGMREIELNLYALGGEDDLLSTKIRLGSLAGTTCLLSWRGLPGEYRGRLKVGVWQDVWNGSRQRASTVQVVLTAQPYLYGSRRSVLLATGAQWVRVAGNRESWPVLSLTPSGGVSSVSVSCGSRHLTYAPGAPVTGLVVFDCAHRVARANGNVVPVTLDSDWFPLVPKSTQVTLTNCSGSLSYEPQTMI